jgi:LmbE family N-acetylglucosaminyl deacetylase
MPTEPIDRQLSGIRKRSLYLLPHQDDEFGVFTHIEKDIREGKEVVCAFCTDGAANGVTAAERNIESKSVLTKLGVSAHDIHFVGETYGIPDSHLIFHSDKLHQWLLSNVFFEGQTWDAIYVPAWEGGHIDHDALHFIVACLANQNGTIETLRQFPLYNAANMPRPWFKVQSCLKENGATAAIPISYKQRAKFLKLCLSYPSQIKSWVGLFPFVLLNYIIRGCEVTQAVSLKRIFVRPHNGELFYERKKVISFEQAMVILKQQASDGKINKI